MAEAKQSPAQKDERVPSYDEIAIQAYYRWEARGCPHGSPEIDWQEAEQELRTRNTAPSQAARAAKA